MSLEVLITALGETRGQWLHEVMLKTYVGFDISHGYDHIAKVVDWLEKILAGEKDDCSNDARMLAYVAAVVHDWCDPKYKNVCEFDVRAAITVEFGAEFDENVNEIITNMSYSAELNSLRKLPLVQNRVVRWDRVRRWVQAADWLTSVGKEGLVKSLQYNYHILGHRDEKLYSAVRSLHGTRLVSYIETVSAIENYPGIYLFAQAHAEMQLCVDSLEQLEF